MRRNDEADAMFADVTQSVGDGLSAVARVLGRVSVLDWVLVGGAIALELPCVYVRDEDADLEVLRRISGKRFKRALAPLCPDELVVHYRPPHTPGAWGLHVWGDALMPGTLGRWSNPLKPLSTTDTEAVYRIRIFDDNKPLEIIAHVGDEKDTPTWAFSMADKGSEVWLRSGDLHVYEDKPADWGIS